MKPLKTYAVLPSLPEALEPLRRVATDLHWAWAHDAIALLRRLDDELWEQSGHNPVAMLGIVSQDRLDEAAADPAFLAHLDRVATSFDRYRQRENTWFQRTHGDDNGLLVAYCSAEFGLTECLSIFAGGLGILAGDHLKSASDLGIPLVGVGLLYQEGYFRQRLNQAGWQQEHYIQNDVHNLPVQQERNGDGEPVSIEVPFPDRSVKAYVWRADVGRVTLYLLDTNHPENDEADRAITRQLYGGDGENRLRQEIVLGIGGVRALDAVGVEPTVFHMNEGHSAFLVLEYIRTLMESEGMDFAAAREAAAGIVFTTHTPVPAGHDYFSPELIQRYLGHYATAVGIGIDDLLAMGRKDPSDDAEEFCNTVVGLRSAATSNGVSSLHGAVSRQMWQKLWPELPVDEVPIGSVTNGVHFESWISMELKELYDRYLGPEWTDEPAETTVWSRAASIPPAELWRTHQLRRDRLVSFTRRRLAESLASRGAPQSEIDIADVVLDPNALTIGFSRRFATYKRATLLLRDPDRLTSILNNSERPVQIIYAGKAHPRDDEGKELIRSIIDLTRRRPDLRRRLVFIADYDMAVTRSMVQGSDVWLNTPVRPLEASGTSGMKAAANGVLNLSTLDGWWDEAYEPDVGWAIGRRETYTDDKARDDFEAHALYDLLEREVVPLFYERGVDGLPRRWIERMQASSEKLNSQYNTHRMVREYTERYYLPVSDRRARLLADDCKRARALAEWRQRVTAAWPHLRVVEVLADGHNGTLLVDEEVEVQARVHLGDLTPADVTVELYGGVVTADGDIADGVPIAMELADTDPVGRGEWMFRTAAAFQRTGQSGFTIRVLPSHPDLASPMVPGLVSWA